MTRAILLGLLLGLLSGSIPGPFSTLVVTTALHRGFEAAARVAAVPLVSELFVLAMAALVIAGLPETALRWMGVGGGLLIFYLAYRTWKQSGRIAEERDPSEGPRRLLEGIALSLVSPTPWVFWLLVGAPVFLGFWSAGWLYAAAFAGTFVLVLGGVRLTIAALAAYGHHELDLRWQRRLMRWASVVLVIAGVVLVWQSWVGNFHRMVEGSMGITDAVSGSSEGGS
jgi:threonine/homoserine/homoserine lactone efflux protein